MSSPLRALLPLPLVALLLAPAPAAWAQTPPADPGVAEPAPGTAAAEDPEWERVPAPERRAIPPPGAADAPSAAPEPDAARAPRRDPPVRFVVAVGFDYGFEKLLDVEFDDGSDDAIRANGGIFYAVGLTFLPFLDGRLYTQATIGFKMDTIDAENGEASFHVFPLEIVEYFHPGAFRVGAGLSLALAPRTRGEGAAEGFDADFDTAAGLVLTADYVWRFRGAPRGFLTVGPRLLLQRLEAPGGSMDAHALGAVLGFTF